MVRQLYIILLALHPARFRYRFAFEMLAIFDEASAHGGTLALLADGFRSLVRQWVRPYRPVGAAAPAVAGAPAFHMLDTAPPPQRALVTGAVLSLMLFGVITASAGSERWRPRTGPAGFQRAHRGPTSYAPFPVYPARVLRAGRQGLVVVQVTVSREGRVRAPFVLDSFDPEASTAVIAALKDWRIRSLCHNCFRVARIVFEFRIENGNGHVVSRW